MDCNTSMNRLSRSQIWRNAPEEITGLNARIAELAKMFSNEYSIVKRFHPAQNVQAVFGTFSGDDQPTQLAKDISAFLKKAGIVLQPPKDIIDIRNLVNVLHSLVPAEWLKGGKRVAHKVHEKYVQSRFRKYMRNGKMRPYYEKKKSGCDKKWKFTIERKCPPTEERQKDNIPSYLHSRKDAEHYLWILARLEGRLLNMEAEGLRSLALPINKVRLLDFEMLNVETDALTKIFCQHLAANWSMPKLFTLEKQAVGGMDEMAQLLWPFVLESPTTNWFLIGHLVMSPVVYDKMSADQMKIVRKKALRYFAPMVQFLNREWNRGVYIQARKLMVMPKRYNHKQNPRIPRHLEKFIMNPEMKTYEKYTLSGLKTFKTPSNGKYHIFLDVSGWNNVAGAYNNLLAIINYILPRTGKPAFPYVRCNLMIANDQMSMAKQAELERQDSEKINTGVEKTSWAFAAISRNGYAPWSENQEEVLGAIVRSIKAQEERFARREINPDAVLASFYRLHNDLRKVDTKIEQDSICGIPVPPIAGLKEMCEQMGIWGAKPYGNA